MMYNKNRLVLLTNPINNKYFQELLTYFVASTIRQLYIKLHPSEKKQDYSFIDNNIFDINWLESELENCISQGDIVITICSSAAYECISLGAIVFEYNILKTCKIELHKNNLAETFIINEKLNPKLLDYIINGIPISVMEERKNRLDFYWGEDENKLANNVSNFIHNLFES